MRATWSKKYQLAPHTLNQIAIIGLKQELAMQLGQGLGQEMETEFQELYKVFTPDGFLYSSAPSVRS